MTAKHIAIAFLGFAVLIAAPFAIKRDSGLFADYSPVVVEVAG